MYICIYIYICLYVYIIYIYIYTYIIYHPGDLSSKLLIQTTLFVCYHIVKQFFIHVNTIKTSHLLDKYFWFLIAGEE